MGGHVPPPPASAPAPYAYDHIVDRLGLTSISTYTNCAALLETFLYLCRRTLTHLLVVKQINFLASAVHLLAHKVWHSLMMALHTRKRTRQTKYDLLVSARTFIKVIALQQPRTQALLIEKNMG